MLTSESIQLHYQREAASHLRFFFQWGFTKLKREFYVILQFSLKMIPDWLWKDQGGCRENQQIKLAPTKPNKQSNIICTWGKAKI